MTMRILICCLFYSCCFLTAYCQTGKPALTDDLVKDKPALLGSYLPLTEGRVSYAVYKIPTDTFIQKVGAFSAAALAAVQQEPDTALRDLKRKDIGYYCQLLYHTHRSMHNLDSAAESRIERLLVDKKGDPNFRKQLDSAVKKLFSKNPDPEELATLDSLFKGAVDLNDAPLFKRSASYREWVDAYLTSIQRKKFPHDSDYYARFSVMFKLVNQEVSDPFIKEYLCYDATTKELKTDKNDSNKEAVYQAFQSMSTTPGYKDDLQQTYTNYKRMAGGGLSPDFTYTSIDGQPVNLKALRGEYVYIDVWATWCVPCKAEIPFLTKTEKEYEGKKIRFISLSVDRAADRAKWEAYVKEHHLGGIQVMADKDFSSTFVQQYNINSIPRFILISPEGKIISGDAKRPSDPELKKQLDVLL